MDDAPSRPWALYDALPTAVVVADRRGRVRYANPLALDTLAKTRAEVVDRDLDGVLGVPGQDEDGADIRFLALPCGGVRRVGYMVAPLGEDAVYVFRDISELAAVRDERDRLLRLATIGEAMPSLLHELKNALAGAMATVEVLLEEVPPGALRTELEIVVLEHMRMKLGLEGIGALHGDLRSRRAQRI
ncbi:MAG: hypothetical protein R3B82_30160, partial [Sandaracinaceae bacterium]